MKSAQELESENAELRGQVKLLREMIEKLLVQHTQQIPQFVPVPMPTLPVVPELMPKRPLSPWEVDINPWWYTLCEKGLQ